MKNTRPLPAIAWGGLLCLLALIALTACGDGPRLPTPAPTATLPPTRAPTDTPAPTPANTTANTTAPTATATPAPTDTPAPEPPSATEVLDAAAKAMAAVESGHMEIDTALEAAPGVTEENIRQRLAGDFQVPGSSHFTISVMSPGVTIEYELITAGGRSYLKNPLTGRWEPRFYEQAPSYQELLDAGVFGAGLGPEVIEGFTLAGEEMLGGALSGERVYYLSGPVSGETLAQLLDDPETREGTGEVEYWIGVYDFLVRKTVIRFTLPVDDDAAEADAFTGWVAITLSDFGKPVDIQAPEVQRLLLPEVGDHDVADPTLVAIGEPVEGVIDGPLDDDWFRFQAEEGRRYRIRVDLGTLDGADVVLWDFDGNDIGWSEDAGEPPSPQILWSAALSEEYYVSVQNLDGQVGSYTLTITPAPRDDA